MQNIFSFYAVNIHQISTFMPNKGKPKDQASLKDNSRFEETMRRFLQTDPKEVEELEKKEKEKKGQKEKPPGDKEA